MFVIEAILGFIVQFISNPTILIALIVLIGLLIQKKKWNDLLRGTVKTIVGFTLISCGSTIVIGAVTPMSEMMQGIFGFTGTLPVNESCFAVASAQFGTALSGIMAIALVVNLVLARFYKIKFIYMTGHFFGRSWIPHLAGAYLRRPDHRNLYGGVPGPDLQIRM